MEINGIRTITLERLLDLKLASGMSHRGRLKDLADVQESIRALKLPANFQGPLDPSVRPIFMDLHSDLAAAVSGLAPDSERDPAVS